MGRLSQLAGYHFIPSAPTLMEAELIKLQTAIEDWLESLDQVFPRDFAMIPKFHYMLHYVEEIRRHGPLRLLWTLRFESKHLELKNTVKSSQNRMNPCLLNGNASSDAHHKEAWTKHIHASKRWFGSR